VRWRENFLLRQVEIHGIIWSECGCRLNSDRIILILRSVHLGLLLDVVTVKLFSHEVFKILLISIETNSLMDCGGWVVKAIPVTACQEIN
jgi:hypothetical protein